MAMEMTLALFQVSLVQSLLLIGVCLGVAHTLMGSWLF